MKLNFIIAALLFMSTISFAQERKSINLSESEVVWKGYKIGGSHEGTIKFQSGELMFQDSELIGGSFVVDMNSLSATDLSGNGKEKLENHLKSDDYFDVANYPTARLMISGVKKNDDGSYSVTSSLTIKDVTQDFYFQFLVKENQASSESTINRKEFNIKNGGFKDKAIKDKLDFSVSLVF